MHEKYLRMISFRGTRLTTLGIHGATDVLAGDSVLPCVCRREPGDSGVGAKRRRESFASRGPLEPSVCNAQVPPPVAVDHEVPRALQRVRARHALFCMVKGR